MLVDLLKLRRPFIFTLRFEGMRQTNAPSTTIGQWIRFLRIYCREDTARPLA